ncbi:hypothetical protein [Nostoc sp. FACHB-888]|uniref:hypothetical protein n=1 Tax=Nostoc sp. FACHB-888 TaxID=2692842 RepID=UPI0016839254|nr:hypothetical protein [Nostoc sp. FACHB-888]MBD2248174.1 hypothetical protein [Nostoc sp. FACHB-888]
MYIQNWKLSVVLLFSITYLTLASLGDYSFASCIPNVTCPIKIVDDKWHIGNSPGKPGGFPCFQDPSSEKGLERIQKLQEKDPQAIQKLQQGDSTTLEKLQQLTPGSLQRAKENCSHPNTKT